jgi:hypothetical protein
MLILEVLTDPKVSFVTLNPKPETATPRRFYMIQEIKGPNKMSFPIRYQIASHQMQIPIPRKSAGKLRGVLRIGIHQGWLVI